MQYHVAKFNEEHMLFSYLDEYMNANGQTPQVAGVDHEGDPFIAWLDEEGGDCVGLRVVRLVQEDGGTTSSPAQVEAPLQGHTSGLVYPVKVVSS
jgi:hypothetical protein